MNWQTYFVCNFCNEPFNTRVKLKGHKWEKHPEVFKALLSIKNAQYSSSDHPVVDLEEAPVSPVRDVLVFGQRPFDVINQLTESGASSSNGSLSDHAKEMDNFERVEFSEPSILDLRVNKVPEVEPSVSELEQPSVQINESVESEGSTKKKLSEGVQETASCSPELQLRLQTNRKLDSGLSAPNEESTEGVRYEAAANSSSNQTEFPVQINERAESEGSCSEESTRGIRGTVIRSLADLQSSVQINEGVETAGSSSNKLTEIVKETAGSSSNKLTEIVKETAGSSSNKSPEIVKETGNCSSNELQPLVPIITNALDQTNPTDPPVESLTFSSQQQIGEQADKGTKTFASHVQDLTTSSDQICAGAKRKIHETNTDKPSESPTKHLKSSPTENPINPSEGNPIILQTIETREHLPTPVPSALDRASSLREAEDNSVTNRSSPAVVRSSPRIKRNKAKALRIQKLGMGKASSVMKENPKRVTKKRRRANGLEWYDKKKKSLVSRPVYKHCMACRQKFNSTSSLNAHFDAEHKHQKPQLRCPGCDLEFWNEWRLNLHIKKLHSSVPRERDNSHVHTCEECSAQFGRAEILRKHLLDKHGIEVGPNEGNLASGSSSIPIVNHDGSEREHVHVIKGKFLCYDCDERFPSERAWSSHVENVHKNKQQDTKKTKADSVEYALMPKLSPQVKASNGPNDPTTSKTTPSPRKETCPVCQDKFQYRREVESHMKRKHQAENKTTTPQIASKNPEEIHKSDAMIRATRRVLGNISKPFNCPLCSAQFEGRDLQVSHLQTFHHLKEADTRDLILHGVDAQSLKRGNDSSSIKLVKNNLTTVRCFVCKNFVPSADLAKHTASDCKVSHRPKETGRGRNDFQDKDKPSCSSTSRSSSASSSSDSSSSGSESLSDSSSANPLEKFQAQTGPVQSSSKSSKVQNPGKKMKGEKISYICQICNRSFTYHRRYLDHVNMHKKADARRAIKAERQSVKKNIAKKLKENADAANSKKKAIDLKLTCLLCEGKFACQDVLRDHLISNHRVKKETVENYVVEGAHQKAKPALQKQTTKRRLLSCQASARSSKIQPGSAAKKVEKVISRGQQRKASVTGFKREANVTFPSTSSSMESKFKNVGQDQGNVPIQIMISVPASMVQQSNFEKLKDGIGALMRNEVSRFDNEESAAKEYLGQKIKKEDCHIFRCDVCGIRYDSQDKLNEHKKCHLVKEKLYECRECHGKFTSRKRLQNHMLIKHHPKV